MPGLQPSLQIVERTLSRICRGSQYEFGAGMDMRMRWPNAVSVGLALLIGQAASLTMGPLTMGHVTPAYSKGRDRGDSGDKNHVWATWGMRALGG